MPPPLDVPAANMRFASALYSVLLSQTLHQELEIAIIELTSRLLASLEPVYHRTLQCLIGKP